MSTATAMVLRGERRLEQRELPLPEIGEDDALLRVELCGICGSDVEQLGRAREEPVIPGHEPVGIIERIGPSAARRWGVSESDRVVVDPFLRCGACQVCVAGRYELCQGWPGRRTYGALPVSLAPALWGAYSTHLYLHPNSLVYRVPDHVDANLAVLYNALASGFRWAVSLPELRMGETVVVLGCGQRGLASVIAAHAAHASLVVVTGLGRDRHKLDLAKELGADVVLDVEQEDVVEEVNRLTGGRGVDVVVDTTPGATAPPCSAIELVRVGGRIVLAGLKGRPVPHWPLDQVVLKAIRIQGALGVGADSYRQAIDLLASGDLPLERLRTHEIPVVRAAEAIDLLAGDQPGEAVISVALRP